MQLHAVGKIETVTGIVSIVGIALYGIEASVGIRKLFDDIRFFRVTQCLIHALGFFIVGIPATHHSFPHH